MINAELLQRVWDEQFKDKRPYDVLTLVGYDLPDLSDHEAWEEPELNELEQVTNDLAMRVALKSGNHPLSVFITGLALGYLVANREVLEGASG